MLEQLFAGTAALGIDPWLLIAITLWTLPWKGVALWKSAHRRERWWFIVLLVVNTVGVLEIIYIFIVSRWREIAKALSRKRP